MTDDSWKALIRALIYPIQFSRDPVDDIDRVMTQIVGGRALGAGAAEYLAGVRTALQSDVALAALIPQPHSEAVIRTYLAAVEKRLA